MPFVPLPAISPICADILDDMHVRIVREACFPGAGDAYCDALTRAALAEGRPAFWSLASPHRSHFVAAACTANRHGLEQACAEIEAVVTRRGRSAPAEIAAFLNRLAPANVAARRLLGVLRRRAPAAETALPAPGLELV